MARLAWKTESAYAGTYDQELNDQDRAYSTAAIFSATSFLEATVNELFNDAAEQPRSERFHGISQQLVMDLARYVNNRTVWNQFKSTKNAAYRNTGTYGNEILNKFQFACVSLGQPELIETTNSFIMTRLLIDTRNKITHYEPETVPVHDSEGPVTAQQITQRLNGLFPANPFSVAGNHNLFPALQLGHGISEWAVLVAMQFADDFFDHVNLKKAHEHVRPLTGTR